MTAILKDDPPDMTAAERHMSPTLARIVDRCLEKDPAARFQTASDLAFALDSVSSQSDFARVGTVTLRRNELFRNVRVAWGVAASALALAVLAIATALYVRPVEPEPVVTRLEVVTPATSDAFSFALSPDGRQLAFVANGARGSQLWVRRFDQPTAQPLAGTEGAISPFWAPDGRALGFFADAKLKRVDLAGGAPQVLADAPQTRGGTWSRDGVIVFAPAVNSALVRVPASGGTPVPVTRLEPGQNSHRWPQFLPDGRLLFSMVLGRPETRGIYVASLGGGTPTRVAVGETAGMYAPPGYLLRVSQGVLVAQRFDLASATLTGDPMPIAQDVGDNDGTNRSAFSVSAAGVVAHRQGLVGRRQLVWVDRAGRRLGAVGSPDDTALANLALAPDGRRVAVNKVVQGNIDVWLIDLGRNIATRLTFDGSPDTRPLWSPDGSQVIFTSTRTGNADLFAKSASGAVGEQPLLAGAQFKTALDWSSDGRFLLYSAEDPKAKNGSDLWALPMMGERKPLPIVQSSFDEIEGQLSPDGRWVAFASNESGRYEIYVRPFPGSGGQWQISTAGGTQPRWRRDGQELFYVASDGRLMAAPVRVASDARALDAGTPMALFSTNLASGPNIAAAGYLARAQYVVAADGRFLMSVSVDDAVASSIAIVQNWDAGLKK